MCTYLLRPIILVLFFCLSRLSLQKYETQEEDHKDQIRQLKSQLARAEKEVSKKAASVSNRDNAVEGSFITHAHSHTHTRSLTHTHSLS